MRSRDDDPDNPEEQQTWAAEQAQIRSRAKQFVCGGDLLDTLTTLLNALNRMDELKATILTEAGFARKQAQVGRDAVEPLSSDAGVSPSNEGVAPVSSISRYVVTDHLWPRAPVRKFLEGVYSSFQAKLTGANAMRLDASRRDENWMLQWRRDW
jgi:hypothetical protein